MVLFEAGKTYLTATITLSNSVHMYLPRNSTLALGDKREDFGPTQATWYLVMFDQCTDCSITGKGRLDGRGRAWVTGRDPGREWIKAVRNFKDPSCVHTFECRPRLLGVKDSSRVHIAGLELFDSIYWTLHIIGSHTVTVQDVAVNNDFEIPNNDGVDIDSSKLVWISGMNITAWDDGMCIKATYPGVSTEDVLVENTTIHSRASAVKVGTEGVANFRNLVFQNIDIVDSHRGLSIQLRDNGTIEDVLFENITMTLRQYVGDEWGNAEPIYITALPRTAGTKNGAISDVTFRDITATAESGILVIGSHDSTVENLAIVNMTLDIEKLTDVPGGVHDLRPSTFDIVHNVSDDAIYLENANHINITNMKVTWGTPRKDTWGQLLNVKPGTVHALTLQGLVAHDESAHPHAHGDGPEARQKLLPVWALTQASRGVVEWVRSLRARASQGSGSLSLQENAATGVQARNAASSASTIVMSLTGIVLAGILVAHLLDFRLIGRLRSSGRATMRKVPR
ncbi:hypothetical protein WJX73_005867 [Symbiochloris irregularis]|uniref:Uncharacterized protein n=1 Tax=Symbiochloris irregularis TaxID=706552 RepID=A0AAW1NIL8_9CHLO